MNIKNLYFAFGHGHSGLTLGGATGYLIACMVNAVPPCIDPTAFSAERFRS